MLRSLISYTPCQESSVPSNSALCTLSCLIYPWNRILGKTEMGIRTVIHYLLVNGIVLGAGFWFEWYRMSGIFCSF